MRDVDVLVIGSGFGGLTAGSLAAASGLEVLVAEQHARPGGCAGDFALEGTWFPAGATVVTGLEPGGILRQVFEATGTAVDSTPLDPSIELHIAGQRVRYWADPDAWQAEFAHAFPNAGEGYRRFWHWVHRVGGAMYRTGACLPSLPIETGADAARTFRALSPAAMLALPYMTQTLAGVKRDLDACGDSLADALIDGLLIDATGATAEHCSASQGAIALDIYRRGCQWVEGGTASLAMRLVRNIRGNSGEVRFLARVDRLLPARDGWRCVLANGEVVFARAVVANIPPQSLCRMLGATGEETSPTDSWGAFLLHLAIDATGLDPVHPFQQVIRPGLEGYADGDNCLVSIFPGKGRKADRWSISVSTHTRVHDWWGEDSAAVECNRARLEERLMAAVEVVVPDVRERSITKRSATPRTFEQYTLRPGGYVGGPIQRPQFVPFMAPGHRPARRIFMAGDHVFPGQGTVGVALSGINAYRDVCDMLGVRALL